MKIFKGLFVFFILFFPLLLRSDISDIEKGLKEIPSVSGLQPPDAYDKLVAKIRLKEQWNPAFKDIDCVKVVEDTKWENAQGLQSYIGEIVSSFFHPLNLSCCFGDTFDCQATLSIKATFRALSKKYKEGLLYTGAYVEGKIVLQTKSGFKIEESFTGNIEPPDELPIEVRQNLESYKNPQSAPFRKVLDAPGSLIEKLGRIYHKCFGTYALVAVAVIGDPFYGTPYNSLYPLLSEIGEPVSEVLLYLLRNSRWDFMQMQAATFLMEIKSLKAIPDIVHYCAQPMIINREDALKRLVKLVKESGGIEAVLNCLKEDDPRVRVTAVEVLARVGGDKAMEGLTLALKDESPEVREKAMYWISNFRMAKDIEPIIAILRNTYEREETRVMAAEALGQLGDPRARQYLEEVLQQNPSWQLNEAIREALEKIPIMPPSPEEIPNLVKRWRSAVEHDNTQAVGRISELLSKAGAPVVAHLLPIITNPKEDKKLRSSAFDILLKIKDERLIKPCVEIARDANENLQFREMAIQCLGNLKAREASDLLLSFLTDIKAPISLRATAASSLGKIGELRAIEALYFTLKLKSLSPPTEKSTWEYNPYWLSSGDLRFSSAKALVSIGEPALERIKDATTDEDVEVRVLIARALKERKEQWAKELLFSMGRDEDANIRIEAADGLIENKDSRGLDILLSVLKDENVSKTTKFYSLDLIEKWEKTTGAKFNDTRFVEPLMALLKGKSEENRYDFYKVLDILTEIGDPTAVKAIASLLKSDDKNIRSSAMGALFRMGALEQVIDELIYVSKNDEESSMRISALKCLSKLNNQTAINAIVDALKYDPDYGVRAEAASILGNLHSPYSVKPLAEYLISSREEFRREEVAWILKFTDRKA
ncbi:MAG: HEAT repeat domain-containing protein, partial [bacterium]